MCLARLLDSLGDQSLPCFVLTRLTIGFVLGSPFVQWDQQISGRFILMSGLDSALSEPIVWKDLNLQGGGLQGGLVPCLSHFDYTQLKVPNACAGRCCAACGLSTVVWRPSNQHTTFALDLAEVGCVRVLAQTIL